MELMIAMAIFSIFMGFLINSRYQQQEDHITQIQAVEMQQSVRAVMFMMKQNIRMAGFDPTGSNVGAGITTATAATFGFTSYDTANSVLGAPDTYAWVDDDADGDFDITLNGTVMAENIQNLTFAYFGQGRAPIAFPVANLSDIRSVDISITAVIDQDERARTTNNNTRTLTSTVLMRNMGI